MARESSATAMGDFADGFLDEGPSASSIGCSDPSQYFSYAQSVFQSYRGPGAATEGGELIISSAFVKGGIKVNQVSDSEQEQARQSVMMVLSGKKPLDGDSMTFLSELLEISFKANAWNDGQYRQLRDSLSTRAHGESLGANDAVAFELEGLVRAVDYIRSEQRRSKAA